MQYSYSPTQFDAIRYARLLSSAISVLTTGFFIGSILVTSQLKLTLPMRRIIFSFCIYGLIHGIVNFAPVFYLDEDYIRKPCSIEGFFRTIGNAGTSLYLTSMLVYYYCTVKLNMTDVKFKRKVEGFLHVFINIYSFIGAIVIASSRLYFTDDNGICDVRPNPSCTIETTIDSTCKKEKVKATALRWVFSDALIVLNFLYIIVVWRKVIQAVTRTNKQSNIRRFGAQSSCNATPNTTSRILKRFAGVIGFSENSRTSKSRQHPPSRYSSFSRNRQQSMSRNSAVAKDQSDCKIGEDGLQMTRNELSSLSRSGILRTMSRKYSALDCNISDAESNRRPSRGSRLESVEHVQSRPPSSSSRRIPDFNLSEVRSKASEVISPLEDIGENGMERKKLRRTSVPKRRASTRIQIQKELINLQSKLFISFYVLVWIFPLCCHVADLVDKGVPFALMICSLLLNPLVGSLGCFLYCFPHIMSKVRTRDTSWCSTVFEVLKKGGDGDRIGVSRRRNSVFDQDKGGNVLTRTVFKTFARSKRKKRSREKSKQRNCLGLSVHDIESLRQLNADEDGAFKTEKTSPLKKPKKSRESEQRNCLGLSVHDIEALKQLDADEDKISTKERMSPLEVGHTELVADSKSAENIDCVKKLDEEEQLNCEQDVNDVELCYDKVNDTYKI